MRQLIRVWPSKIYHCHLGEVYGVMMESRRRGGEWMMVKTLFWLVLWENKDGWAGGRLLGLIPLGNSRSNDVRISENLVIPQPSMKHEAICNESKTVSSINCRGA